MVQKCFWQMADSEDGTKSSEINLNENSTLMKLGEVGVELGVNWGWSGGGAVKQRYTVVWRTYIQLKSRDLCWAHTSCPGQSNRWRPVGTCARDRRALQQQLALNVHVKHSDLTWPDLLGTHFSYRGCRGLVLVVRLIVQWVIITAILALWQGLFCFLTGQMGPPAATLWPTCTTFILY